ncbi:hypothetical protein JMJ77_0002706 [Colletotrichum scovillei]|uniref:Uncharacterized protein n=1 Tax=Colletotrichum scovillei TaxID=1209932 RepID=A0A9P7UDU0_9PEZI|nr:hypothetical protein JMJ77_0002706 [Colletotrichum scovillei]KAG7071131.1 hypothetical protein JMJ76_0002368 [Colletotrichum scovillei]KAG7079337.1 hypothetical protein JMJ78_0002991 [Colletotrichum scovillei]
MGPVYLRRFVNLPSVSSIQASHPTPNASTSTSLYWYSTFQMTGDASGLSSPATEVAHLPLQRIDLTARLKAHAESETALSTPIPPVAAPMCFSICSNLNTQPAGERQGIMELAATRPHCCIIIRHHRRRRSRHFFP